MTDTHVYKILSAEDWTKAEAQGYPSTPLDLGDGYVHLSTRDQVGQTLALHYKAARSVRLLEYKLADLEDTGALKWEPSRGGDLFPHLYAQLPIARATRIWTLQTGADQVPALPEDL
jgi:uncharacterized protein (DUF952 family)